jgi:acyl carrier protein
MEEIINSIISDLSKNKEGNIEGDLIYTLGFDSKKIMQLIVNIENKFNISINEDDLDIDNFKNVEAIANLVRKYQAVH